MGRILVVNPNSSVDVTSGIIAALAPFGDHFEVVGMEEGPATVATEEHVARAGLAFAELAARRPDAAAFVTACFSDPGLDLARARVPQPVFGIQEAGILSALAVADRFGIVALSPASVQRHLRKLRLMGVDRRLAGELALPGVSAVASGHDPRVFDMLVDLVGQLKDRGAGAVVLGCAGMAPIRTRLEDRTGVAIIDPVIATGAMALGSLVARQAV
ncbi:aspartate/glutamate racemase family protein [Ketogulonicigenium vulgare]|uniref:aspartate/glutamate racemase family protein n=1 Tax=Ketogulonicigenium vulgare TaxID=92945 RepID=UPI0023594F47|nr:aspartate/glutamate racemase family protein [Ketogulonicigenium vulgare]